MAWGGGRRSPFGPQATRRAAILAIVLGALALTVVVPLRTYLSQQADLGQLRQREQALRARIGELNHEKARLSDPAYIEAQARKRLRFVMPGETPYIVQLPGGDVSATGPRQDGEPHARSRLTWYSGLWHDITGER